MKKPFLVLSFLFPILAFTQGEDTSESLKPVDITGIWLDNQGSDYYTVILYNNEKDYIFTNFSFFEQNTIFENLLEENSKYVKSVVHNPDNGWRVYCEYTYIDKNTLKVKYTGDIDKISILNRQNIIPN